MKRTASTEALGCRMEAAQDPKCERGVELDPVWPEGRFNAALVAAELEFYDEAVEQTRAYLELAPNSPDAQDARDHIVIWQDKATQKATKSSEDQSQQPGGKRKK